MICGNGNHPKRPTDDEPTIFDYIPLETCYGEEINEKAFTQRNIGKILPKRLLEKFHHAQQQ